MLHKRLHKGREEHALVHRVLAQAELDRLLIGRKLYIAQWKFGRRPTRERDAKDVHVARHDLLQVLLFVVLKAIMFR